MKKFGILAAIMVAAVFSVAPVAMAEAACPELQCSTHSADTTGPEGAPDNKIELTELLRVIQFYNVGAYHCDLTGESEDGFTPGPGCAEELPDIEILNLFPPSDGGGIIPESENFVATISATEPINVPFSLIWTVNESVVKTETINTQNIQVWIKELDWSPPRFGTYTISLTVDANNTVAESNESNNTAETTITACPLGGCEGEGEGEGELDTEAPVINVDGPLALTIECGQMHSDNSYVTDNSGEASLFVKTTLGGVIVPPVDGHTTGVFTIEYRAEDAAGNKAGPIIRTITVADSTVPMIALNGPASFELERGENYIEQGATALDACEGSLTVTIGGDTVNTAVPGVYTITYNVVDSSGNTATQRTRTVTVVEAGELEITNQSTGISVPENTPVELTVGATGSNLTFRWEASGTVAAPGIVWEPVTTARWYGVSGMNTATLKFSLAQISSAMWYRCVVSDGTNTVITKPIWLHVIDVFNGGGTTLNAIEIDMEAQGNNLSITVDPPTSNPGQYFFDDNVTRILFEFYFKDRDTVRASVAFDGTNPVNMIVPGILAGTEGILAFEMRGLVNEADDQGWISIGMQSFHILGIVRGDARGNENPDDYHWIFPKGLGKSSMTSILDAFLGVE